MATKQRVLQSVLDTFWEENFEEDRNSSSKIVHYIKNLMDPLLIEISKREPLLNFLPLNSITLQQGKTRQILEVLLCFNKFPASENDLSIEDGNSPIGFAFAKLPNKKNTSDELCIKSNSSKKFLSAKVISEKLLGHLRILLNGSILKQCSSEFNVELIEHLEDNAVSLRLTSSQETYKVNLIPSIPCKGRWTFGANAWLSEESHWPSKPLKQEAIIKGIHLVGRPAPTKSPCQWQITFLEPMKMLLDDTYSCTNKCLEIMKLIVNRSKLLQKAVTFSLLDTITLNLYKKYPLSTFWQEEKFIQRFIDFVEELRKGLEARKIQDFFIFDLNLLKDMDQKTAELCIRPLYQLLNDPEEFFIELKSHGVQDTHL